MFNLTCLLRGAGYPIVSDYLSDDIKKRFGYVALDNKEEMSSMPSAKLEYTLPDCTDMIVSRELFQAPEFLFKPSLYCSDCHGIHVHACRKEFARSIVVSGGNTMFKGLPKRLEQEVTSLFEPDMNVKVIAGEKRQYNAWSGGSILASLATYPQMVGIVHRHCIQ